MKENKNKVVILALVAVIVLLLGVVGYTFLVSPAITGYAVQAQNQGVQYAIYSIMLEAAKCQQVPLVFGNQTINIIAVDCLKQAGTQEQAQPQQ